MFSGQNIFEIAAIEFYIRKQFYILKEQSLEISWLCSFGGMGVAWACGMGTFCLPASFSCGMGTF